MQLRPESNILSTFKCPIFSRQLSLKAAELLGVAPGYTVVVEDAVAGIQAGKRAGAQVWALPTTCAAVDLVAAGADHVIENLEGLL